MDDNEPAFKAIHQYRYAVVGVPGNQETRFIATGKSEFVVRKNLPANTSNVVCAENVPPASGFKVLKRLVKDNLTTSSKN